MKYLYLCFLFIALLPFNSCQNQDDSTPLALDCEKLTSREEAENLMREVTDISIKESSRIIENLIGEWGLIGVVPGWIGFETGEECIRLTIDENNITLEDVNFGNNISSPWELKITEVNGFVGFHLETNEDVWNNRMGMQIFSENIMFGSGRVDDGANYIYEKIK